MAEQKEKQVQTQVDALQGQLAQAQQPQTIQIEVVCQQLVNQPVRVLAGQSAHMKPDYSEWRCIVLGFCPTCLVMGFLIWMLWHLNECSTGPDCFFA